MLQVYTQICMYWVIIRDKVGKFKNVLFWEVLKESLTLVFVYFIWFWEFYNHMHKQSMLI